MQRLKQRTDKAIAHAARKATRHNNRAARLNQILEDRKTAQVAYHRRFIKKTATQVHWEKWNMGPLAPKRQLEDDDMQGLSTKELVDPMVKRRRLEAQERKEGKTRGRKHSEMILGRKPMEQMFRVGDRVCCIEDEGHEGKRGDLGKIGVVREVLKLGDGFCTVELPQTTSHPTESGVDLELSAARYTRQIRMPDLRPVKTLYDPTTNEPLEDVIIGLPENLHEKAKARKHDLEYELSPAAHAHERKVQRWAKEREEEDREAKEKQEEERKQRRAADKRDMEKDYDIDTLRYEVDEKTWTPTLLRTPLPDGVLDELRGKYSKFRTRHDPDYIARFEAAERAKLKKEELAQQTVLVDPLKELSLKERAARPVESNIPSDDLLEKIGRKMAERGVHAARIAGNDQKGANVSEKDVGVRAAEMDEELKEQRQHGKQQTSGYWPVKGWKEKQRRVLPVELLVETSDSTDTGEASSETRK